MLLARDNRDYPSQLKSNSHFRVVYQSSLRPKVDRSFLDSSKVRDSEIRRFLGEYFTRKNSLLIRHQEIIGNDVAAIVPVTRKRCRYFEQENRISAAKSSRSPRNTKRLLELIDSGAEFIDSREFPASTSVSFCFLRSRVVASARSSSSASSFSPPPSLRFFRSLHHGVRAPKGKYTPKRPCPVALTAGQPAGIHFADLLTSFGFESRLPLSPPFIFLRGIISLRGETERAEFRWRRKSALRSSAASPTVIIGIRR